MSAARGAEGLHAFRAELATSLGRDRCWRSACAASARRDKQAFRTERELVEQIGSWPTVSIVGVTTSDASIPRFRDAGHSARAVSVSGQLPTTTMPKGVAPVGGVVGDEASSVREPPLTANPLTDAIAASTTYR